jgi:phosphoribosylaminoimidazolecarboxamide formyltransferase/IMP cyclohydrolase
MKEYDIPAIDLVIVDLYPFEQTVASGASEADIIEKIDIGGISLIRAGAKNFKDVVIIPSKNEYAELLEVLNKKGANTDIEDRKHFAERAFGVSSHYDTAIHSWFAK